MASCCGTARVDGAERSNGVRQPLNATGIVAVQPVAQPGLRLPEKTAFSSSSPHPHARTTIIPHSPPPPSFATAGTHASASGQSPLQPETPYDATRLPRPAPAVPPWASTVQTTYVTHTRPSDGGPPVIPMDEGKMSVSIDFGTTFSGVAYGSSRIAGGTIQQILHWPGSSETFRKVPTCLLYDEEGAVRAWGLEAVNAMAGPGLFRCEWFKLFLEPKSLRDESAVDPRLPPLPPGKRPVHIIIDFLFLLWEYAKTQITAEIGAIADLDSADVWLTVPAAWDAKGCEMMREAAIAAGLVRSAHAGDVGWRERLRIITEPEAAAVHCVHLTDLHKLKTSQTFMICDAGGGTVDLAVYKIIGELQNLEIAEVCARSGANCGSLFLDLRFRELVKTLLAEHPAHLDAASLAYFMHSFSETDKLQFQGAVDDNVFFHFNCFNVEDQDDPTIGLINGELAIPGNLIRSQVFDPVVDEVLALIDEQANRVKYPIDALLLVGGFSASNYLLQKVQEKFGSRIRVIARPDDADTATVRGGAKYGLARRPLVSSIIAPRSYMVKVKLPAEPEDLLKRPAYVTHNNAGFPTCENRLQYLVAKGAILRKGQKVRTRFCKFSQTPQDRTFVATLYTSDHDEIMRYTDEAETTELCKWTVDLSTLPSFQENVRMSEASTGFYTDFELGLELDSAEVRGILLFEGHEWGRVVFDFLS